MTLSVNTDEQILAVDPGLTVGYAMHLPEWVPRVGAEQANKWEFLDWADPAGWERGWFDVVVVERFIITPKTAKLSRQHDALDVIGVLRWWCHQTETTLVEYSAAEAKTFSDDDKLKAAGMWTPGRDHANDASRHLMLYLVRERLIRAEELK